MVKKTSKKEKSKTKNSKQNEIIPTIDDMLKAGVHFGHRTSKWHPKMKPYIFTTRNGIHIIDLEKSLYCLKTALEFLKKIIKSKGIILFVGTKTPIRRLVRQLAEKCEMPYINERWLGGTLTNFATISKRLKYFKELTEKKKSGELKKYTKKEQRKFDLELKRLEARFSGIKNLNKLPEALLVFDLKEDLLAVKEAKKMNIPIIAFCDTNVDPTLVDYPIPCNDDAASALRLIGQSIVITIQKNKDKAKSSK